MITTEQTFDGLSSGGLSRLGGLLAGLDQLDPILVLPAHPKCVEPGISFGRYHLCSRLGAGACGVVLLAHDLRLSRQIVVKVPQPVILTDPPARERFVREARAVAVLDHPGIVPVYEAGEVGGLPYIAAAYVPGPTLADWFAERSSPLPAAEAVRIVRDIARAVHHAHEHGVLHCDLKPGNVLLAPPKGDGPLDPVVTDFGLARILTDDPADTRTYQQAGTPLYMSPEQARGDRRGLTARTDVYALGVILYELLTGQPPFAGQSGTDVLNSVQHADRPCPSTVNPDVPRDLRAVCLVSLAKEPKDRYASAAALADDLDYFLGGFPVKARQVGAATRFARWARRNPVETSITSALVLLLIVLVTVLEDWWAKGVLHEAKQRETAAELAEANERAAAGEFVDLLERVRRRRTELEPNWPRENLVDLRKLAASPVANRHLAMLRTEAAAALGGVDLGIPRIVAEGFDAYNPAFSPDGKTLALGSWRANDSGKCSVLLVDLATGVVRRTLEYATDTDWEQRYAKFKKVQNKNNDGCRSLVYSPNGRWLVLGTRSGRLIRWDVAYKAHRRSEWRHAAPLINPAEDRVNQLAFAPSGNVLVSTNGDYLKYWTTLIRWSAVLHHKPAAQIVRPARADDPLFVRVGHNIFGVPDQPPWVNYYELRVRGGLTAAAPSGTLVITNAGSHCRPYALWPGHGADPSELMTGFTAPNDARTEDAEVNEMAIDPDGRYLATGAESIGHLKLWSIATGQLLSARTMPGGSLRFAFSPDGRTFAVCDQSRTLLFTIPSSRVAVDVALQPYQLHDAGITLRTTVVAGRDALDLPSVHSFDTADHSGWGRGLKVLDRGFPQATLEGSATGGNNSGTTAVSADGTCHAYMYGDAVHIRSRSDQPVARKVANLRDMAFTTDGRLWLAQGDLIGWDPGTTDLRLGFTGPKANFPPSPVCLAVGPSGLLVGRSDGALSLVDPANAALKKTLRLFNDPLTSIGINAKGITVAGSALGAVKVLRLDSDETAIDIPNAHRDVVMSVAVGTNGCFATGSRDRTVKVWNPAGELMFSLPQHRPVKRMFWSPDGTVLTFLVEGDRGLRRWDLSILKAGLEDLGLRTELP